MEIKKESGGGEGLGMVGSWEEGVTIKWSHKGVFDFGVVTRSLSLPGIK